MDKHTFKASIVPLFDFFKQEPSKDTLLIYYSVLGNYEPILLDACIKECFSTSKWMPKPAEINEIANRLTFINIFDAIESDSDELLNFAMNKKLLK
jgi:hypothetical protein